MAFYKDKAKLEGILLGNLLVGSEYITLGQLYARMHADSRVIVTLPRLMKVISLDINKGLVEWGFNGYCSDVVLHLTPKGREEAAIRIKENKTWLPEDYEKPDDVEDIADQYCVGMVLPPVNDFLYSTKVLEEYIKGIEGPDEYAGTWGDPEPDGVRILPHDGDDKPYGEGSWVYDDELEDDDEPEDDGKSTKDSKPTSGDNAAPEGINSAKEGATAPRTIVFCGDVAFWADTHEELTSEEYKDILGITEEDLANLSKGCDGECFACMEDYQEDVDEPASTQYCYFCGAASDLQANFCNRCGHRLVSGSRNPGITGAHLHLVYEDEEPGELPVRRRRMADNLRQQDMLSDMDALYRMLMELGMLD